MEQINSTKNYPVEENIVDWSIVQNEIKKVLGKDIFESWIKNIKLEKEFNHYIAVSIPTRFMRDWVVSRYADKILDVIQRYKKSVNRIEFQIKDYNEKNNNSNASENSFKNITLMESSVLNYNRLDSNKTFDNFVVGESNRLAFTAAKKVCDNLSQYNPLYIYGGVGMGKTHLLNAVGLEMKKKYNIMFISAERFMYHFIKSIKNNDMMKFKDFFRKSDVFIIDDIQFIRGKENMQEEFFHTFNELIDKNSQIVISSDRAPSKLDRIQDRIKSRLSGGLVIDIQSSDHKLRYEILKQKFSEIKNLYFDTIDVPDEIFNFLASEIRVSVREMIGALNRVLAFSRIYNKKPSILECKSILKDIINTRVNEITIENIQKAVSIYYKISLSEMLSPRRSRSLVRPRQIAMYLSKNLTTKSLPDIGRCFSGRDHTTVIHSVKTVEKLMNLNSKISEDIEHIKNNDLKVS